MDRDSLVKEAEELGNRLNQFRLKLVAQGAVYSGGEIRAAEETLQLVFNDLNNKDVPESEL